MVFLQEFKKAQIFFISPVFWILSLPCQAQAGQLTLQWEASHPTGERQVSLVFKSDRVDLFTNTSLWQGSLLPRLGHFTSVLNEDWKIERERMDIYQSLLKEYFPVGVDQLLLQESFPSAIRDLIQEDPHSAVVRLNEYEMKAEDPYFSVLENIFHSLWSRGKQWVCVDCVTYRIHRKGIERRKVSKDGATVKRVFSRKQLNCYSINEKFIECTDTHDGPTGNGWGGFRISL